MFCHRLLFAFIGFFLFNALSSAVARESTCTSNELNNKNDCSFLEDLYYATNGENWYNNTNWLTSLSVCDWYGVECAVDGSGRVNRTEVGSNNLAGSIPESIKDTVLWGFDVSGNKMEGQLPAALGSVSTIWGFNFGEPVPGYGFQGTLPSELGLLTGLELLGIGENRLTGTVPAELVSLTSLRVIDISNNQLTGFLPESLCSFAEGLEHCFMEANDFQCPVASCLTDTCAVEFCEDGDFAAITTVSLTTIVVSIVAYVM